MAVKPGYKQTEIGVIPEEWGVSGLAGVAEIRTGVAKNASTVVADPVSVHYLRVANVQDGFLDLSDMGKIEVRRADLRSYAVLPGDVLMNEGGDLDKLARGSVWRGEFDPCVHQNHVFAVRCGSSLYPEFLSAWTRTSGARRYFMLAGKQTTNLASINKTALGGLHLPVPPLPEQRAIAAALGDVDALLESLGRLIAKKRDLKQAAMQQLLTGQTRLPGFAGRLPSGRLGDLIIPRPGVSPLGAEEHATFIGMEDLGEAGTVLTWQVVPAADVRSGLTVFERDDILVAKITPCFENGKGALLDLLPTRAGFGSTEFHVLRAAKEQSPAGPLSPEGSCEEMMNGGNISWSVMFPMCKSSYVCAL